MAAIGFRVHTGWAACVVLDGAPGHLEVLLRRRLELLPADGSVPRFVYHQAAETSPAEAVALVKSARTSANQCARLAVKEILRSNAAIRAAGVAIGSVAVPQDLGGILASHPLIHSAEGALYQQALTDACARAGLAVTTVREKRVWQDAAAACGLDADSLETQIAALRKHAGPPWGGDQRIAAAAALLAQLRA